MNLIEETLTLFATYGCYGLTDAWCAVYGLVVALAQFVVEFLWGFHLYEDGSWGDGTVGDCIEVLQWGCQD